ncbi:MAG: hypothetical protein AAB091_06470 [Elusimicrobiota bacterium]
MKDRVDKKVNRVERSALSLALSALSTLSALSALSSCSSLPRSAVKTGFDFTTIHAVEVRAKDSIAPLISRELLQTGVSPLSSAKGAAVRADAVLKIATARENPERRYIIQTAKKKITSSVSTSRSGEETSNTVSFEDEPTHAPLEVSGAYPYTQSFLASPESKIIATYAQVSLAGELVQSKTNEVLWAGAYAYEGVDLDSALEGAVRGLVRQIPIGANR